jgi:type I restriction-modification system DNA methylase subunit
MVRSATRVRSVLEENRVEALRLKLGYPFKQRDPQGSSFWYLHPGENEAEAQETAPIAIGFAAELNDQTDEREIKRLLTSKEWQDRICGNYQHRLDHKPVMYLLLPTEEGSGSVPLVLPTEGKLRPHNIQSFAWGSRELETRLNRLKQGELPIASNAMGSVPLVERAFYEPIKTAQELAQLLAKAARQIERVIPKVYKDEERRYPDSKGEAGYLHKLLKSFQRELLPSLRLASESEKEYSFADIYAQTIAYALFTARVFGHIRDEKDGNQKETLFDRQSAWQQLPKTNPFLRQLFQDVSERQPEDLGDELISAIAEIFAVLRAAKMGVILQDFREKLNREDIVIRFYEDFLTAYKREMRECRGVYYTPKPVVSYMVRSVDTLLKEKFNKPLGIADPEVMILDPACGTGTFLLSIVQFIYGQFQEEPNALVEGLEDQSWSGYVQKRLLPRIFGFELLMAPYAIAHLKLGLFLQETGYEFDSDQRLGVYLTNTLEQISPEKPEIPFEEFIAAEGEAALNVKRNQPIMLIIGNPPYSNSTFEGEWIMELMNDYKEGLNEKKSDLNREEWKFFRFAQEKIKNVNRGIVSFVVNNTFVDAVTHWSLRRSLTSTFNEISIADLHGSVKKQERCPDGSKDEGVFDIQQGVAITLFVRDSDKPQPCLLKHTDLWGLRQAKYSYLDNHDVASTTWKEIQPSPPHYFLTNRSLDNFDELRDAWSIAEIFEVFGSGVKTDRDALFLDFDHSKLETKMKTFYSDRCFDPDFIEAYRIENSSSYNLLQKRKDTQLDLLNIKSILYRPFDSRFIYYARGLTSRPAWEVMQHMVNPNLALIAKRQARENLPYTWFSVTDSLVIDGSFAIDNKGRERMFPLYLYPEQNELQKGLLNEGRRTNFSKEFLIAISSKLGYLPEPEDIFYYMYSIFHSSKYRTRYSELLKIDYPRVPLTGDAQLFSRLSVYGKKLVFLHLMKSVQLSNPIVQFSGNSNSIVDTPKYVNKKIFINKKGDGFSKVPEQVWSFYVGGHPVCAKWLKDRKGRTLSPEDITHYQRIIVALQETIQLMQQIDEAIPGFPIT